MLLAKARQAHMKVLILKGAPEEALVKVEENQALILTLVKEDEPILCRYYHDEMEVLNFMQETPELLKKIETLALRNLEICQKRFKPTSLYLVKPLHSLFLAYV